MTKEPVRRLAELVNSCQYVAAWQEFGELMLRELDAADLAEAYLYGAITRAFMKNPHSAVELGQLAEQHAQAAGDAVLLGKTWANLTEFYRRVGDQNRAMEVCQKWFDNLGMYPELEDWRGRVLYNRAHIRRAYSEPGYLDDFRKAAEFLKMQYQLNPNANRAAQAVMACQMAAWTCYETAQMEEGDRFYAEAQIIIDKDGDDDTEAKREQVLLRLNRAYQEGTDPNRVISLAKEFLTPGPPSTKEQEFWACWFAGMTYAKYDETLQAARVCWLATRDIALSLQLSSFLNRQAELDKVIRAKEKEGAS